MELDEGPQMLPPPPGSFIDREELIQNVGEFGLTQGYVVTIKQSKKEKVVILGCDRGGIYRDRRRQVDESTGEPVRKRKCGSRLTNCPFELVGKKEDVLWVLNVKNGSHNHEPMKDVSEHPSARRFNEKEVLLIKDMTEAGLKPRQILNKLRQTNPELLSTPKHVYNVKAKLRHGDLATLPSTAPASVRRLKTFRPSTATGGNSDLSTSSELSWRKRYPPKVPNLIGGRFFDSISSTSIDVLNPATQQVVTKVPLSTAEELKAAVCAAKRAFVSWRSTPITSRQRIMFKFQDLIRRDIDKIAGNITSEQGKTLKDAFNDVSRGLEFVEHACGMANLQMGEFSGNISNGIDSYNIRQPLGVCAGISSFNFPAMIPLMMFPIAITCGNTFILKPPERAPGACMHLAELAMEAGLPNGVLNIIHGANDIIDAMCGDEEIKAVSYIGSDAAGMYIHARASANSRQVQTYVGAKSCAVVMPDANMEATLNALLSAGFGSAVQKSTSISSVILVGGSKSWEDKLVERTMALKVDAGTEPGVDIGPVISKQVKERISRVIQSFVDNGANLLLDGRKISVSKYELGNFVGPTILTDVTQDMDCYKEEILGPVLLCLQAGSLDEAIYTVNRNKHGNGASIFTSSPAAARKFQFEVESGQVGVNVAIPAPLPLFLFNGCKASFTGDVNSFGKSALEFYTRTKTVSQQWRDVPSCSGLSSMFNSNDSTNNGVETDTMQSMDFTGVNDVSLGLHLRDFSNGDALPLHHDTSNYEGAPLPHQGPRDSYLEVVPTSKDFQSSDGESLGEQSRDIPTGSGSISPLDGSHWTLHF